MSSINHSDDRIFEFSQQNSGFDAELAYAENKNVRRGGCCGCGCCLGCCGFLLLLILGLAALAYCFTSGGVPLIVSEETTVITEPLKSDGETVDFHQAIQIMVQPDVQPDANGFMVVWRGYGLEILDSIDREDIRQQYLGMCDHFGFNPAELTTWSLPRWTPGTSEQWLAEVKAGLDAVQTAAAGPHYFVPLVRNHESDLVGMSQPLAIYAFHERLSVALRTRADIRFLEKGDIDGAWKDIFTSIRLFRSVTVNHAWLKAWGEKDNESLLTPIDEIVPTLSKWTPQQLEQAIKDLESLPDWQDRQTILKTIQFMLLDMLSVTGDLPSLGNRLGVKLPDEMQHALHIFQHIGFDWNLVAKEINHEIEIYGELLDKVSGKNLEEQFRQLHLRPVEEVRSMPQQEEWQAFMTDHFNRTGENPLFASGRSRLIGAVMGFLGTRGAGEMYRLQLIEGSRCQALRLALALERFHRTEGRYPHSLEELGLQPGGMPLQYERQGAGYHIGNMVVQLEVK